jgi:2-dehydropantoate 2-reductase
LGAYISKAGKQIDLIDPYVEHINALNKNGAHVTGQIDFCVPVKALTPEQMDGKYDLILLMAKQTYNESAFKSIKEHIHEKSTVVTLQNGLPERLCIKEFGEARVMGCPVGWGAILTGPGVSRLTSEFGKQTFELGRPDGKITEEVYAVKDLLESMCPVTVSTNLFGSRFTKLLTNATFSGMSAVLGAAFGEIMDDPKGLLCLQYIANECIKIARAANIVMEPLQGFDLGNLLGFTTDAEREATSPVYFAMWEPHRLLTASMLFDLKQGKKCEINHINGVVCDMGDQYNIDTPLNDQVVNFVSQIEAGKLKFGKENLDLFRIPGSS